VSSQPASGGGSGFQAVGGGPNLNGNGNGANGKAKLTPAQQLLGAPAPAPAVYPAVAAAGSMNGDSTDYQPLSDESARSPNAHRRVYTSVAQNPNEGCCGGCAIM